MNVGFAVGLGASMGDPVAAVRLAVRALERSAGVEVTGRSRLSRTPPFGGVAARPFVNAVVVGRTSLAPDALHARLRAIEARLGRRRSRRWADRAIDLDLLLYGDLVLESDALSVPHPRMRGRDFVLAPLREAAPDATDPRDGARFADLPPARTRFPVVGVLRRAVAGPRRMT